MDAIALMDACDREYQLAKKGGYELPLLIDLPTAVGVVGSLQLALRHPGMQGPAARIARGVVARMIERLKEDGFVACAELAVLGNDPANDVPRRPSPGCQHKPVIVSRSGGPSIEERNVCGLCGDLIAIHEGKWVSLPRQPLDDSE